MTSTRRKKEEVLSHIEDIEQAGDIVDLLKYDEDTAGGLMGTEMIVVNENWSMPKCIDEMRKQAEEMSEIYYVYVVDDDERLKGVLPLAETDYPPIRLQDQACHEKKTRSPFATATVSRRLRRRSRNTTW